MRVASRVALTQRERAALTRLAANTHEADKVAQRASIVLMAADGAQNKQIATTLRIGRAQAARWRERYLQAGLNGLLHGTEYPAKGVEDVSEQPVSEQKSQPVSAPQEPETAQPVAAVLPPRGARHVFRREALMKRLLDARGLRCVMVQGPAGSGKTTTLAAWRKDLMSLGYDTCWLSLSRQDNDPARFFSSLLASIAQTDPGVVRDVSSQVRARDDAQSLERAVIALVQALGRCTRVLVLVLDDLYHLSEPLTLQALQWLLDYAPRQLHLALGSRTAPGISLERLRLQGELAEFDMRDLRFTLSETERFLSEQPGGTGPRDAARLHALTDGWAAGLHLLLPEIGNRHVTAGALPMVKDASAVASYFQREVLSSLLPQDLALLQHMAGCQRFCASLGADMLERNPVQVRQRLDRLVDGLFVQIVPAEGAEPWYRLHPLLRETLRAGGEQRIENDMALHARAWRWFQQRGLLDEAVFHAVRADEVGAAVDMVDGCAHALLSAGALNRIAALLRHLPAQAVDGRFSLLVVKAFVQLYARDFNALRMTLERLGAQEPDLDPVARYTLCVLRAGLALQQDDCDAAAAMLPGLLDVPANTDALARNGGMNMVAWLLTLQGEFDRARRFLEESPACADAPRSGLFGRCIDAMGLARTGGLREAGRIMREAMEVCERHGPAYVGLGCMAAGLLADNLYELNETEAACRLLEPRLAVLERVALSETVLRAFVVLCNAHALAGRDAQADACVARLEAYAGRYRLPRLHAEALALRVHRFLREGHLERANDTLQVIEALAQVQAGAATRARIALVADRVGLEFALHTKDGPRAVSVARRLLRGTDQPPAQASLNLLMAMAHLLEPQDEALARRVFLEAVQTGHRLDLARTLLDALGAAPAALNPLTRLLPADPVLAFYVGRLHAAAEPEAITERPGAPLALTKAMGTLSEREREILALLSQTMSNKRIATVLNVSTETVKWHLKNLYAKLGVWGRSGAAARLRDLSLAPSDAAAEPA